jgi:hypothetical protein
VDLSATDAAELRDIGWHWETAYTIDYDGETYTATRIGSPEHVVTADTAAELRSGIRTDYFAWCASLRGERMST